MKKLFLILVVAFIAVACAGSPSPTATPPPNSPVVQQLGTLNTIAVGVAVVGGLAGLALSILRRKQPEADDEPQVAPQTVVVTSKTSKKNKKKRK